jgi:hypothetical protein
MNNELERIWKEASTFYVLIFYVVFCYHKVHVSLSSMFVLPSNFDPIFGFLRNMV